MGNTPVVDRMDYKNPGPQVVKKGRVHRLTVEVYITVDATPDQIEEAISLELGYGGMGPDNPLYNGGWEAREVTYDRDTGLDGYTLWDAQKGDKRSGRTVLRKPGQQIGFVCDDDHWQPSM